MLTPKPPPSTADTKHAMTFARRGMLAQGAALTAGAVVASLGTAPPAVAATDRYARGMTALQDISGDGGSKVIESLADIAPDLGRFIVEFTYGDVYPRPGLDPPQRQLVTIGALAAQGDTKPQLNFHTAAALQVGVSPVEIIESIMHLAPFTGFPRVLNAIAVVREVFTARGTTFEPPVLADARSRYERGAERLAEVDGQQGWTSSTLSTTSRRSGPLHRRVRFRRCVPPALAGSSEAAARDDRSVDGARRHRSTTQGAPRRRVERRTQPDPGARGTDPSRVLHRLPSSTQRIDGCQGRVRPAPLSRRPINIGEDSQ